MTCTGRCYALDFLGVMEGEKHFKQSGVKITVLKKKSEEPRNESVIEIEANEFLKFIKYSIVEQYISCQPRFP